MEGELQVEELKQQKEFMIARNTHWKRQLQSCSSPKAESERELGTSTLPEGSHLTAEAIPGVGYREALLERVKLSKARAKENHFRTDNPSSYLRSSSSHMSSSLAEGFL